MSDLNIKPTGFSQTFVLIEQTDVTSERTVTSTFTAVSGPSRTLYSTFLAVSLSFRLDNYELKQPFTEVSCCTLESIGISLYAHQCTSVCLLIYLQ
jgi:hypothetical protein